MWIYGKRAIVEAIKSGKRLDRLLLQEGFHLTGELSTLVRELDVRPEVVPKATFKRMFRGKRHQGVAAFISPIDFVGPEEVIECTQREKGVMLVLDHLEDPQNVGNILRSAEAFGASGILLPKKRSAPISEVVVKASQGAVFYLKIAKVSALAGMLKGFQERGGWVYALDMEGEPIQEVKFTFPMALVVGSEGKGISKTLLNMVDFRVKIPMYGKIESLNVASATAIALFWIHTVRKSS